MIKCLITDFGRVLGTFESRFDVLKKIALLSKEARNGGGDWHDNWTPILKLFGADGTVSPNEEIFYHSLDTGRTTLKELWLNFLEQYPQDDGQDFESFKQAWCSHLKIIPPTVQVCREVQEYYPLVGVSNGDGESLDYFSGLLHQEGLRFHRLFLSAQQRLKKPELFDRVADTLVSKDGIQPRECLYIDDRAIYVKEAIRRCFKAFYFDATTFTNFDEAASHLRQDLLVRGMNF